MTMINFLITQIILQHFAHANRFTCHKYATSTNPLKIKKHLDTIKYQLELHIL